MRQKRLVKSICCRCSEPAYSEIDEYLHVLTKHGEELAEELMKRARKLVPQKPKLLRALEFVSLCQKDEGSKQETHCIIYNRTISAFNGVVALGTTVDENLDPCAPHTLKFLRALEQCGEEFAITQFPDRLLVRSGDFQAYIPYADPSGLVAGICAASVMPLGEQFAKALEIVGPLASEKAQHVVTACVQIDQGCARATNNVLLIEAWHGYELPHMLLPKIAVATLLKIKQPLTGFGYRNSQPTFWFDESWMSTQCYEGKLPDSAPLFSQDSNLRPIDPEFVKAVKSVAEFSDSGNVYCLEQSVTSTDKADSGAMVVVLVGSNHPKFIYYEAKSLLIALKHIQQFDEMCCNPYPMTMWTGNGVRGILSHLLMPGNPLRQTDDDIPF